MSFALNLAPACEQLPVHTTPIGRWHTTDGELAVCIYRETDGYLVRILGRADFRISMPDRTVTGTAVPGCSMRTAIDLYENQVDPMIRGQLGELVIHASAVLGSAGVMGFVAPSGFGKSTIAAAFALASHPMLTDDGLTLTIASDGYSAHSGRPKFRLWQDSQAAMGREISDEEWHSTEKSHVAADHLLPFYKGSGTLSVLYFLGPGQTDRIGIDRLPSQSALSQLLNQAFLLDVEDRQRLTEHFASLAALAERVPCFSLDYPREYRLLPEIVSRVSRHAKVSIP